MTLIGPSSDQVSEVAATTTFGGRCGIKPSLLDDSQSYVLLHGKSYLINEDSSCPLPFYHKMADALADLFGQPPVVTIESERLQLKTIQMTDVEGIMPIVTDPEVMKWT